MTNLPRLTTEKKMLIIVYDGTHFNPIDSSIKALYIFTQQSGELFCDGR